MVKYEPPASFISPGRHWGKITGSRIGQRLDRWLRQHGFREEPDHLLDRPLLAARYLASAREVSVTGALFRLRIAPRRWREVLERWSRSIGFLNPELSAEAAEGLKLLKALTRAWPRLAVGGERHILVLGQRGPDADCLGESAFWHRGPDNVDLVRTALAENPGRRIWYYTFKGDRTPERLRQAGHLSDSCRVARPEDGLIAPEAVDRVYTLDSLLALEYLLFDVPVSVFARPFYAGFGLTDDRRPQRPGARRPVTATELFAMVFLLTGRYQEPVAGARMSLRAAVATLGLMRENQFFRVVVCGQEKGASPADLADCYSSAIVDPAGPRSEAAQAVLDAWEGMEETQYNTLVYSLLARREISSSGIKAWTETLPAPAARAVFLVSLHFSVVFGYIDNLQKILNIYSRWYEENQGSEDPGGRKAALSDLHALSRFLYHRDMHVPAHLFPHGRITLSEESALLTYWELVSRHFQYDRMQEVLDNITASGPQIFHNLCQKANRAGGLPGETDPGRRYEIYKTAADEAREIENRLYRSPADRWLNELLYRINLSDSDAARAEALAGEVAGLRRTAKKREYALHRLVNFLLDACEYDKALKYNGLLKKCSPNIYHENLAQCWARQREVSAIESLLAASPEFSKQPILLYWLQYAYMRVGRFGEARELSGQMIRPQMRRIIKYMWGKFRVDEPRALAATQEYYQRRPQPARPRGVVFGEAVSGFLFGALALPFFLELKKRGYVTGSLISDPFAFQATGVEAIDRCLASLPDLGYHDGKIKLDWEIDLKNELVRAEGVNFYQGFYETLVIMTRKYDIDYDTPQVKNIFRGRLLQADSLLRQLLVVERTLADQGWPVYFVNIYSNVVPGSIVRDFCLQRQHDNLQLVYLKRGFDWYSSDAHPLFASTLAVVNATLHPRVRTSHLGVREKFEQWYQPDCPRLAEEIGRTTVYYERKGRQDPVDPELIPRLENARRQGRKIICLFVRALVDLGYPDTRGGPVHRDIIDWLRHSLEVAAENKEVLLLIKPHPVEIKNKVNGFNLRSLARDYLPERLPSNVVYLEHLAVTTERLAGLLDAGVLWSGTAGYELTILGVPVMVTGYWGLNDYLFDLPGPVDRAHYEAFIQGRTELPPVTEALRKKAAAGMIYRNSEEVSLPMRYIFMAQSNDQVGFIPPDGARLDSYLAHGDIMVEKGVDRFFD